MKQRFISIFDFIIYWSIIIFPFSISIAPAFSNTFFGLLLFSFLIKKILKKERLLAKTAVDLPFLFLVIFSGLSIFNSLYLKASAKGLLKLLEYGFIYLILVEEIKDRLQVKRIIISMVLGAAFASSDAVWQIIFGKDFIRGHLAIINIGLKRATAAFPNANVLGVYLSPIAPIALGLSLYYLRGKQRALMFLAGLLILAGVFLTFSRPTALAVFLAVFFLAIIKKDKILNAILILFLLAGPFVMPRNIKDWAKQVNYNPVIFMCNTDRISIYRNAVNMIKHHPFIGVGLSTFPENYLKYKLPEPPDAMTGDTMYAHNNFLHMAGEIGLFGLAAFFWLLLRLFKQNIKIYKSLKDDFLKIVSLCLSAALFAFLVNGLTETSLYYSRVATSFWFLIGLSLGMEKFCDAYNKGRS